VADLAGICGDQKLRVEIKSGWKLASLTCEVGAGGTPAAKPAKGEYRRKLPHIQVEDKPVFVTFCTYRQWELPESVRDLVLQNCLHDHGLKLHVHGAVVLPDHIHLVFTPLKDDQGNPFSLAEILGGIKGASAHRINKVLKRRGKVWQTESFDHILRSEEKIREKVEYICQNPIRKGLVQTIDEYPWVWREWVEGQKENP
jgi:REP element-mobilizing transposase RayT